jgi:pyridoxal phosphate enzyme (YggS family)
MVLGETPFIMTSVADNLARIRNRIAAAAARSGRRTEEITLVAVTKYVDSATARQVVAAGCHDLGESRPQDLWAKAAELARGVPPSGGVLRVAGAGGAAEAPEAHRTAPGLPFGPAPATQPRGMSPDGGTPTVRWHLIGHLQRNKVERTLSVVSLIHSADSVRLIQAIDQAAATLGRRVPILLEVNISGDKSKHGFRPEELVERIEDIAGLANIDVRGLMAMAGREGDVSAARRDFARLRGLRDRLRKSVPDEISLIELSMGMSGDFDAAIEEGATIVRIGSALFEGTNV